MHACIWKWALRTTYFWPDKHKYFIKFLIFQHSKNIPLVKLIHVNLSGRRLAVEKFFIKMLKCIYLFISTLIILSFGSFFRLDSPFIISCECYQYPSVQPVVFFCQLRSPLKIKWNIHVRIWRDVVKKISQNYMFAAMCILWALAKMRFWIVANAPIKFHNKIFRRSK